MRAMNTPQRPLGLFPCRGWIVVVLILTGCDRKEAALDEKLPQQPATLTTTTTQATIALPSYQLSMSQETLDALDTDPGSNQTYPCSLVIEGADFGSAQIRYRGQWARSWPKKPLKIFLPRDRALQGHHSVNLNSAWRDPAMIRETLAYHIYAACGAIAPRSRVVQVSINGQFRGVYVEVEQVDKPLLKRFGLKGASLFKAAGSNQADERDLRTEERFARAYEDEAGKTNAWQQLGRFCRELNAPGPALEFFEKNVEVERYINYLAATVLVQHWDGFNKNHFLVYDENGSGKWQVLPWDLDRTLGDHWNQSFGTADLPILLGTRAKPGVTGWNRLQDRFFSEPALQRRFAARLRELLEKEFNPERLFPVVEKLEKELAIAAPLDRERWPSPAGDFTSGIDELKQFIRDRRAYLQRAVTRLEKE